MNTKSSVFPREKRSCGWVMGWDMTAACPMAFLVSKQAYLFFQILFLSLLIKLFCYVRHFLFVIGTFQMCIYLKILTLKYKTEGVKNPPNTNNFVGVDGAACLLLVFKQLLKQLRIHLE